MLSIRALVPVVLAAGPAFAETIEQQRRELALAEPATGPGFHASGFAQLAAGALDRAVDGELATGGELRLATSPCDIVDVGGQGRLRWSEGAARTSAEQWASVCLPIDVTMMGLAHRLEWDVRPALLAPLQLRRGENRRETLSLFARGMRLSGEDAGDPDGGTLEALDLRMDASWLWSPGGPVTTSAALDATILHYTRPQRTAWGESRDHTVDLFVVGGSLMFDTGFVVRAWLLRVANYRLGRYYLTGGVGFGDAGAGEKVDKEREVQIGRTRAELAVASGDERIHWHVRATRDLGLAPDGLVTVDNRLAAGTGTSFGDTRVGLEAALAATQIHAIGRPATTAGTGGVGLAAVHRLGAQLQATARLDVAKSFYAPGADGMDPLAPRWAVQAVATLQATLGR